MRYESQNGLEWLILFNCKFNSLNPLDSHYQLLTAVKHDMSWCLLKQIEEKSVSENVFWKKKMLIKTKKADKMILSAESETCAGFTSSGKYFIVVLNYNVSNPEIQVY